MRRITTTDNHRQEPVLPVSDSDQNEFSLQCPAPTHSDHIRLDHGGGGQRAQQLLEQIILPRFDNSELARRHDSALLQLNAANIAFTTDAYVVKPLQFPGGDIGKLAVYGTVNDLLMAGAIPRYLSCSLIIEEGLPIETLSEIMQSMAQAADETGVNIVTGDTKVVERGHGDGLYINTSGIGERPSDRVIAPQSIRPGDAILLSSDIGRHGLAIMAQREGLQFDTPITSDCASLRPPVSALLHHNTPLHCLRDATRGGLASVLIELAETSDLKFTVEQSLVPVSDVVASGCELLGLDPFYVANEGCFVAILPQDEADHALALLREHAVSRQCAIIGRVEAGQGGVELKTLVGTTRPMHRLSGNILPRIC